MKPAFLISALALILLNIVACKNKSFKDIAPGYYDPYGRLCSIDTPSPSCSRHLSEAGYFPAVWHQDPSYDPNLQPVAAEVYDPYTNSFVFAWGWFGHNGIFYIYPNGWAVNEVGERRSRRDLVTKLGQSRERRLKKLGSEISNKYALSAEVGVRIARTLDNWGQIVAGRERTKSDLEHLSKEILGVELSELISGANSADSDHEAQVIEKAARHLSTSPENMKRIIREYMN